MRHLEPSLFRPHPSRLLGWSRGRKWVQRTIDPLKHRFLDFTYFAFWAGQEKENEFSTSPKSNFGLVKRQKMTFKCHSTTWIVLINLKKNHIFCWSRSRKWLQSEIRQLVSLLFRLHLNRIWASPEAQKKSRHRFLELTQVAFCFGQEAENEFKVTCDPLKQRFFDFTQVPYWGVQGEENDF